MVNRWGSDEDLISGEGGGGKGDVGIGLRELNSVPPAGNGAGKKGIGRGVGKGGGSVRKPDEVRLGDIRVNSTWEITVDDK